MAVKARLTGTGGGGRSSRPFERTRSSWPVSFRLQTVRPESIHWEIVASPVAPLTLYANLEGLEGDVVYRSRDAGTTWQAVGGGSIAPGPFGIRAPGGRPA